VAYPCSNSKKNRRHSSILFIRSIHHSHSFLIMYSGTGRTPEVKEFLKRVNCLPAGQVVNIKLVRRSQVPVLRVQGPLHTGHFTEKEVDDFYRVMGHVKSFVHKLLASRGNFSTKLLKLGCFLTSLAASTNQVVKDLLRAQMSSAVTNKLSQGSPKGNYTGNKRRNTGSEPAASTPPANTPASKVYAALERFRR